ncbi:MAG: hypothetical protein EBR12_03730 [Proteobacteria bacterium]|nr:hypothetical protein [Pseudomonadota bacterium]
MIRTGFFGFLKMQQTAIGLVLVALSLLLLSDKAALSEGRIYEGSEEKAHCTLWDTQRLRWPQTSMGREKTKCRRKAVPPTAISKVCRLKKVGKDAETGQKLCIYSAQGRGDSEVTVPISPSLNCQRTYSCKKDD